MQKRAFGFGLLCCSLLACSLTNATVNTPTFLPPTDVPIRTSTPLTSDGVRDSGFNVSAPDSDITPTAIPPTIPPPASAEPPPQQVGEVGVVTRVIDGDTIEVQLDNGPTVSVRYLGMNTTERGEVCYNEATEANEQLVLNQRVQLVPDAEDMDRFGRLLRYIYVGNTLVNAELVAAGWAEAVCYEPNCSFWEEFISLEQAAAADRIGCHQLTDLFDDDTYRR